MFKLRGSCHCKAVCFEVESHTPYPFILCYCSICRKTAGGGGYAINIMGDANTLKVKGSEQVKIYQAIIEENHKKEKSTGQRHFCGKCGSCLWIYDPSWPDLLHPFASAIDTPLPKPPEKVHIMINYAASWCEIPGRKRDEYFPEYPDESIEQWHRRNHLWVD